MNNALIKNRVDHRDWDFHRTFSGTELPNLPDELNVDAGLWMPDQNKSEINFNNPPMPYGCTDYTSNDLCADQDGVLYNPAFTDSITHANTSGGSDVRTSLLTTVKNGTQTRGGSIVKRTGVFNVQKYDILDYFDSIRYAMLPTLGEKRSVSWGTPWFTLWEALARSGQSIMPIPDITTANSISWHNSKFCGWKTINGIPYLINKSWQGTTIGDNGFLYFSREVVNAVMEIQGTCAFTVTKLTNGQPIKTINTSFFQWAYSILTNIFNPLVKPSPMPQITNVDVTPTQMPQNAPQSIVSPLCDKMCLAIQNHEGWTPGSTSYRNNNPGNLRFANQIGNIGHDSRNFTIFKDYQSGYNALKNQILIVARGNSKVYPNPCTIQQFFNIYAPNYDANNPIVYAKIVADAMGVATDYLLSNLIS